MASRARGGKSSSTAKLLTTKLLEDGKEQHSSAAAALDQEQGRRHRAEAAEDPSPERREEADEASSSVTDGSSSGGEGPYGPSNTSVRSILCNISKGSTMAATPWKLTRAVVHLEDAWKGRVSPCPPLEKKEPATRALFKLRWRYRGVEFAVVHLLLCES